MSVHKTQARAAEMSALGAAMLDGEAAHAVVSGLSPDDFTYPENRALFEAARALWAEGEPVNVVTLLGRVEKHADVGRAGGLDYIVGLMDCCVSTTLTEQHIDVVRECGRENRIAHALSRMLQDCGEFVPALEGLLERERGRMAGRRRADGTKEQVCAFLSDLRQPDCSLRVPTGLPVLDGLLGGLERGSVSCLAARPSAGKTALALNWLVAAVRAGHRAAFFSLEMGVGKLLGRIGSIVCSVDNAAVSRREVSDDQVEALSHGLEELASGDRLLLYEDARSVAAIREVIARDRPAVAFVDFLQFVGEEARAESENYRIAGIVREFKRLARAYRCHICCLSQVGRSGDGKPPTMRDLYGSGSIEQGSDVIVLLDRPYVYDRLAPDWQATLFVGKNKDGACGMVHLGFDGRFQRFSEI